MTVKRYNLDLPDAIAYRQTRIPQSRRSVDIPKSVFDYTWLDDITLGKDRHLLLIAAGVFFYLEREKLCEMVQKVIERYPQGQLFFDAASGIGYRMSNKMVRKSGNTSAEMHFYVNGSKPLYTWSPKIKSVEILPFFHGVKHIKEWSVKTRIMMRFCDLLGTGKYVRVTW